METTMLSTGELRHRITVFESKLKSEISPERRMYFESMLNEYQEELEFHLQLEKLIEQALQCYVLTTDDKNTIQKLMDCTFVVSYERLSSGMYRMKYYDIYEDN